MQGRKTRLVISVLLILAGPVLFIHSLQLEPPIYSYEAEEVTNEETVRNTSVPIDSFSSKTHFGLRTTETRRQVVEKSIQSGEHKSITYIETDKAVEYEGNYYMINTSHTGGISDILILVMTFGITLGITLPLVGGYLIYESTF